MKKASLKERAARRAAHRHEQQLERVTAETFAALAATRWQTELWAYCQRLEALSDGQVKAKTWHRIVTDGGKLGEKDRDVVVECVEAARLSIVTDTSVNGPMPGLALPGESVQLPGEPELAPHPSYDASQGVAGLHMGIETSEARTARLAAKYQAGEELSEDLLGTLRRQRPDLFDDDGDPGELRQEDETDG